MIFVNQGRVLSGRVLAKGQRKGGYELGWKEHVDKIGVVGSFIAAACCLGLPAVVAILTAIGLGLLINDAVLRPLELVFLALTVAGQVFSYRAHHRPWPLFLAFALWLSTFLFSSMRMLSAPMSRLLDWSSPAFSTSYRDESLSAVVRDD